MQPGSYRQLIIPRAIFDDMLAHAQEEVPLECCGLLAGRSVSASPDETGVVERSYRLVNEKASEVEYFSEPRSLFEAHREMREHGLEVLAVYHSHPTSAPIPSKKDLAQNFYGTYAMHLIISLTTTPPTVGGWWLAEETYHEGEWKVEEGDCGR